MGGATAGLMTQSIRYSHLPEVLARVEEFCVENNTENPGSYIQELVCKGFIHGPAAAVRTYVVTDEDGDCVGYLVATIDEMWGKNVLTFQQYQLDHGVPDAVLWDAFEEVCDWAKTQYGVTSARLVTFDETRARLFRSKWGFTLHRITMFKEIQEANHG